MPNVWETDVHGSDGMIRIRTDEGLEIFDRRGTSREVAGPDRRFEEEVEAFLDAVAGLRSDIPSGEDGREVLAIALAIRESHVTGRSVMLSGPATGGSAVADAPRSPR
jgi:predicted dehydrogenase